MQRVEIGGTVYATNDDGTGLFVRRATEGAYHQWCGNLQTPVFHSAPQFLRWIRRHHGVRGRVTGVYGWE